MSDTTKPEGFDQIEKVDHIKGDWHLWLVERKSDGVRGTVQADGGFHMVADETFEADPQ